MGAVVAGLTSGDCIGIGLAEEGRTVANDIEIHLVVALTCDVL
jgi:hypothetical protein